MLVSHSFLPAISSLSELTYVEDDYGKPRLTIGSVREENIYFSLSHTKNAIAVAVSRRPVGIDVEAVVSQERIGDSHFLERTMSATECKQINLANNPRLMFTELWTRKEAYVKLLGTGLDMNTLPMLLNEAEAYTFHTGYGSGYAYSIVCKADQGEN